jgi:hypothetical protein
MCQLPKLLKHFISWLRIGYESVLPFSLVGVSFLALGGSVLVCTKDVGWVTPYLFRFSLQTDKKNVKIDMWSYATPFLICLFTFVAICPISLNSI